MIPDRSAAALLRAVGLLADGPVPWGRPLPPVGAGVFIVELADPRPSAPIELTRVGKWLESVPALRLDSERPTSRALAARLAAFWLPSQPVLHVGSSATSVSRRVAAVQATVLGHRRPSSSGHWLHALTMPAGTRVWWAATSAIEEYEDAILSAFADGVPTAERGALPDSDVVLPFATLARPTGERKRTGLAGSLLPEPVEAPAPPTRIVQLPDGDADGANGEPPEPRRRPAASPRPSGAAPSSGTGAKAAKATSANAMPRSGAKPATASAAGAKPATASGATAAVAAPTPLGPAPDAAHLTPEGAARMRAELDELVGVRRPEVIARIRAAKELGDLKENADYTAAREEQSFLEGRIQAIEARLRTATIVEAPAAGAHIGLGSVVTVESDGEEHRLTIVGSSESNPAAGRISSASPVGRALLGHQPGDEVVIATPAGDHRYLVVAVD